MLDLLLGSPMQMATCFRQPNASRSVWIDRETGWVIRSSILPRASASIDRRQETRRLIETSGRCL